MLRERNAPVGRTNNRNVSEFLLDNEAITITDAGANGAHGSVKLKDFPEGHIRVHGVHLGVTIRNTSDDTSATGVSDSSTGEIGIGTVTVANTNATLTTTEEDILVGQAISLSSGVQTFGVTQGLTSITALTDNTGGTADNTLANLADGTTYANDHAALENNLADLAAKVNEVIAVLAQMSPAPVFDGSATAKDAYLNIALAAASVGANGGEITVNGKITMEWSLMGDD